jgi:hypothetical protein
MARYFSDHLDGDLFIRDDEGSEFESLDDARDAATKGLADAAREELPGAIRREIAIEVSDEHRRPLLRAALWFEVQTLAWEGPGSPLGFASPRPS